jgi:dihydroorotate dehydrogenase
LRETLNNIIFQLYKKIAFLGDPEKVHDISLPILEFIYKSYLGKVLHKKIISKKTKQMNIDFDNPLGLAAGFDKNADYLHFISNIGFGYVEVGTLTPKPQSGNPKPRIFRLIKDKAIINHLGFNNKGIDYAINKIKKFNRNIPIGINIGKNANTQIKDAFRDYEYCLRKSYAIADYITLNISSPNTKDLRQLQSGQNINEFIHSIKGLHDNLKKVYKKHTPLVIKIAPDISIEDIDGIINLVDSYDVDGIICTNTTIDKSSIDESYKNLQGGLSGRPLYKQSNNILKEVCRQISKDKTVIGVGGVDSPQAAKEKINLGANLIQIYTGLVFKGPGLIESILR